MTILANRIDTHHFVTVHTAVHGLRTLNATQRLADITDSRLEHSHSGTAGVASVLAVYGVPVANRAMFRKNQCNCIDMVIAFFAVRDTATPRLESRRRRKVDRFIADNAFGHVVVVGVVHSGGVQVSTRKRCRGNGT